MNNRPSFYNILLLVIFSLVLATMADPFSTYILRNSKGMEAWVIPFGGTITHMWIPDKDNVRRDVILGWDDPTQYKVNKQHPYFGALIGRYANRIAYGAFELDNFWYHTPLNDNSYDTLHGGDVGYDRRVWGVSNVGSNTITLTLDDGDLVEAFPGNVHVTVKYTITEDNAWEIEYNAVTDSDSTIINLTQHSYWNLNGFANNTETILDHVVQINADKFTPIDDHLIPTGEILPVTSAPYLDFTKPKTIGKDIKHGTVTPNGGYDNNLVLNERKNGEPAVTVTSNLTGITMHLITTQPGVQFYSGNFLDGTIGRKKDQIFPNGNGHETYALYGGFALEAQHFPDSIHHPEWPTTILKKGQVYHHVTSYKFTVSK